MGENRHKHTVWMDDGVWDQVESHYQRDNCSTKNEFIEKAVRFYSGYLDTESADAYLPQVLADVLEGKLGALGKRMGHLLFKLSVDQNLSLWQNADRPATAWSGNGRMAAGRAVSWWATRTTEIPFSDTSTQTPKRS